MDLSKIGRTYVERLIENDGKPKILLLDPDTTGMLSLATTQSFLLKNDVFLVDRLDNPSRQKMRHLNCIAFVRPTSSSLAQLVEELRNPRYGNYVVVFSNFARKSQLERLAEADDHEAVTRVLEMFLDWLKINRDFFSADVPQSVWSASELSQWSTSTLDKSVDSLIAASLSLKFRNPQIRVESNSPLGRKLCNEFAGAMARQQQVFDGFPQPETPPLVLVLDRLNDPVTPLVSHWTYQAMVDELVGAGIEKNRVDLRHAPDAPPDLREIVLSADEDAFFADTMYLNYGDIGAAVRDAVAEVRTKHQSTAKLDTVEDIKRAVEELPVFQRLKSNVSKHVGLFDELVRITQKNHWFPVSELEQSLACNENHSEALRELEEMLVSPAIPLLAKFKLVGLYAVRYNRNPQNATQALLSTLQQQIDSLSGALGSDDGLAGVSPQRLKNGLTNLIKATASASAKFPQEDLFNQGSLLVRAQQGLKGIRGVDNVYTQHKPLLEATLQALAKGRLSRERYPITKGPTSEAIPQDVLVFMVGGATFEEARVVAEFNRANHGIRVVLGATSVVNGRRFLAELGESEF